MQDRLCVRTALTPLAVLSRLTLLQKDEWLPFSTGRIAKHGTRTSSVS